MAFIQYQDKKRKCPHTLSTATALAKSMLADAKCDVYVVSKRIQGDYWFGVMTEKDFFPYTTMKLNNKFHDILRTKRFKFDGWVRDPNQGGMDRYYPANTGE